MDWRLLIGKVLGICGLSELALRYVAPYDVRMRLYVRESGDWARSIMPFRDTGDVQAFLAGDEILRAYWRIETHP